MEDVLAGGRLQRNRARSGSSPRREVDDGLSSSDDEGDNGGGVPPVPGVAAAPASVAPGYLLLCECPDGDVLESGVEKQVAVSGVTSLDEIIAAVRATLQITVPIEMLVYDEEFEEFVLPTSLDHVPLQAKVQLKLKSPSGGSSRSVALPAVQDDHDEEPLPPPAVRRVPTTLTELAKLLASSNAELLALDDDEWEDALAQRELPSQAHERLSLERARARASKHADISRSGMADLRAENAAWRPLP